MKLIIFLIIILSLVSCTSSIEKKNNQSQENQLIDYKILFKINEPFLIYELLADDSTIYLCDSKYCKINVYSKKDGKKINSFGREGEGPGEFDSILDVNYTTDKLYVCSTKKLSIFKKNGELIQEIKDMSPYIYRTFIPFENNYITWRFDFKHIEKGNIGIVYTLLDESLKMKREIFQTVYKDPNPKDKNKEPLYFYMPCRKCVVYKDRLYIGCTDLGFYIGVYDISGNMLYEIEKQFGKTKITEYIKDRNLNLYRVTFGDERYKKFISTREIVPQEFIPDYMNFFVSSDKIYVFKFPLPGCKGMLESFVLDLKGNILLRKMLMLGGIYKALEGKKNIAFHDGKLYLVMPDTEDEDNVSISVVDIDSMFTKQK